MAQRKTEKRGRLTGAAVAEDVVNSSPSVLHPDRSGQAKGLQQYFVDASVSRFVARALGSSHHTLDLTAGAGHLLSAFNSRYGVELDADQVVAAEEGGRGYTAVRGDVQRVFPLFSALGVSFRVVVLNPPFGLEWEVPGLGAGNSTLLAVRMAERLLERDGAGVLVAGAERFRREVEAHLGEKLFAVVEVERLFDGVKLPCVVAFWRESEVEEGAPAALRKRLERRSELTNSLADAVAEACFARSGYWSPWSSEQSVGQYSQEDIFRAVQEEYDSRLEERRDGSRWTFGLKGGRVNVAVSAYLRVRLADRREDVRRLESYHRQTPAYFALQTKEWEWAQGFLRELGIPAQPEAVAAIEHYAGEARRAATPLYPVAPAQRLGFVVDVDSLACVKSDAARGFVAGERYPVDCRTVVHERQEVREVQRVDRETGDIAPSTVDVVVTRKAMRVQVGEQHFDEGGEDIGYLLEHFDLPDPGDVSATMPVEVERWRAVVRRVEAEVQAVLPGFRYRSFQVEDTARLLAKGGGVLAWEQGLGKALALLTYARCLESERVTDGSVLFVMPQDLVPQFRAEARKFFGRELVAVPRTALYPGGEYAGPTPLLREGEASAVQVRERVLARRAWLRRRRLAALRKEDFAEAEPAPVWAVTWYEALATTGRASEAADDVVVGRVLAEEKGEDGVSRRRWAPLLSSQCCPRCGADRDGGWDGEVCRARLQGKGALAEKRRRTAGVVAGGRLKACGHVHRKLRRKAAYSVLGDVFQLVCVDEGTKLKGDDSITSRAVRGIRARHRVLATGTPLKNFVADLFWLLWWTLGDSTPRFPYAYEGGLERFLADFAVREQRLDDEGNRGRARVLPQVSNLARLWRLLCSSVVRRRMEEVCCEVDSAGNWTCKSCGTGQRARHAAGAKWRCRGCGKFGTLPEAVEGAALRCACGRVEWVRPERLHCARCDAVHDAVVPLTYEVVSVPWGKAQKAFYAKWLDATNFERHFNAKHPNSPVANTRFVRLCAAALGQYAKLEYGTCFPVADPDPDYKVPELSAWTPTALRLLEAAAAAVRAGRQVLVTSTVVESLPWLCARLCERGVRAVHATEADSGGKARTLAPQLRAEVVGRFKAGDFSVLLVGANAIALGHNLDNASDFMALGTPWDFATMDQQVKRVRRLTSLYPVRVHVFFPENSLGQKKWEVVLAKTATADIALDGRVSARREEAVDKARVLQELQERGAALDGTEVAEAEVAEAWRRGAPLPEPSRRRRVVALAEAMPDAWRSPGRRRAAVGQFQPLPQVAQGPRCTTCVVHPPEGSGVTKVVAAVRASGVFFPAEDSHLYAWALPGRLLEAARLAEALGYSPVTELVWRKPVAGGGVYFRDGHETLLFAVRGRGTADGVCSGAGAPGTCYEADYPRDEEGRLLLAEKPALFYALVERRSLGPYLSLFSEVRRPGWVSWCPVPRDSTGGGKA